MGSDLSLDHHTNASGRDSKPSPARIQGPMGHWWLQPLGDSFRGWKQLDEAFGFGQAGLALE